MSIGVGVIGANPERGWAAVSHVPAIRALPGLDLRAVATSDAASAMRAERAFGAKGYADARALVLDPAVDLVTVAVRVPAHRALVQAALDAGKHVYCEWPLGRDLAEAEAIRDAAASSGLHAALGLQARMNPALRRAAELVQDGAVGRVLGARLHAETAAFGPETTEADAYLEEPGNGATHLTIHGGHAVDAAIAVLGPLAEMVVLNSTQFQAVSVGGARTLARTIPDDIRLLARLASGGALTLEVVGGRGKDSVFSFQITGERGTLRLDGGAARGFQSGVLALSLDGVPQAVPAAAPGLPETAVNVAGVYAALRDDIVHGTATAPGFEDAIQLTRLCDDVLASPSTRSYDHGR